MSRNGESLRRRDELEKRHTLPVGTDEKETETNQTYNNNKNNQRKKGTHQLTLSV